VLNLFCFYSSCSSSSLYQYLLLAHIISFRHVHKHIYFCFLLLSAFFLSFTYSILIFFFLFSFYFSLPLIVSLSLAQNFFSHFYFPAFILNLFIFHSSPIRPHVTVSAGYLSLYIAEMTCWMAKESMFNCRGKQRLISPTVSRRNLHRIQYHVQLKNVYLSRFHISVISDFLCPIMKITYIAASGFLFWRGNLSHVASEIRLQ